MEQRALRLGAFNKTTLVYEHPSFAVKTNKYACPGCNKDVILRKGDVRAPHFSHKYDADDLNACHYYDKPNESQLHKDAKYALKNLLENKPTIPLYIITSCASCHKHTKTPIDLSKTSNVFVEHRIIHNNEPKIIDVACVGGDRDELLYIFEVCNTHKTSDDARPEPWYEFDASIALRQIGNIFDNNVDEGAFECIRKRTCNECNNVNNVNNSLNNHDDRNIGSQRGVIYFNQRGAGCGKTFESIQLVQGDQRFTQKEVFIYLPKMHSAKDVIYNEWQEQQARGLLGDLSIEECNTGNKKQYKIKAINKNTGKEIIILIGTIDSFTYALADKDNLSTSMNYFKSIIATIKGGNIQDINNGIHYAGSQHLFNDKYLIIIDEAQDLCNDYIKAFDVIVENTNIDVYVIGDKL